MAVISRRAPPPFVHAVNAIEEAPARREGALSLAGANVCTPHFATARAPIHGAASV
jgi:hypothetical protein